MSFSKKIEGIPESVAKAKEAIGNRLFSIDEYLAAAEKLYENEQPVWREISAEYMGIVEYLPSLERLDIPGMSVAKMDQVTDLLEGWQSFMLELENELEILDRRNGAADGQSVRWYGKAEIPVVCK